MSVGSFRLELTEAYIMTEKTQDGGNDTFADHVQSILEPLGDLIQTEAEVFRRLLEITVFATFPLCNLMEE